MTEANVGVVRTVYEAWQAGDFSRTAEWADPGIEWVRFGVEGGGGAWTGIEAMSSAVSELVDGWEELRAEAEDYRDVDEERVLVLTRWSGRASGADSEVELRRANLFRVRGGKVVRLIFYGNRDRAFADVGLPPEPAA